MKTALVTGHEGFVGRHMKARLIQDGYRVEGCDTAARWPRDARDLFRKSSRHYDLVVHCAAVIGGRTVIENAPLEQAVNLELDAGLFQWALRTRPGRVVYFSSSAAYPMYLQERTMIRLTEDMIDLDSISSPDQLYGWAKLTGEKLAALARVQGVPVTVIRPFSGYGEDQDVSYPFAAFADRARRGEDPFHIWGSGTQVRDFIHIDDIVGLTMTLVERGIDGPVNAGWGIPVTMLELAHRFAKTAGYEPVFQMLPSAPAGVGHRVCHPFRMREYYTPEVTLAEGIQRALGK